MNKFIIYKSDPSKWKPALASTIDSDQYPAFLGGSLRDPDGDPRYLTKASKTRLINFYFFYLIDKLFRITYFEYWCNVWLAQIYPFAAKDPAHPRNEIYQGSRV